MNPEKYKVIEDGIEYHVKEDNRAKYWILNHNLHRINGPAVEYTNGDKHWYLNAQSHRINGPAIEYTNGEKYWYIDGIEYSRKDYYKELFKRGLISKKEAFIELI